MKVKEILQILRVAGLNMIKYIKDGLAKVTVRGNEQYDYSSGSL